MKDQIGLLDGRKALLKEQLRNLMPFRVGLSNRSVPLIDRRQSRLIEDHLQDRIFRQRKPSFERVHFADNTRFVHDFVF